MTRFSVLFFINALMAIVASHHLDRLEKIKSDWKNAASKKMNSAKSLCNRWTMESSSLRCRTMDTIQYIFIWISISHFFSFFCETRKSFEWYLYPIYLHNHCIGRRAAIALDACIFTHRTSCSALTLHTNVQQRTLKWHTLTQTHTHTSRLKRRRWDCVESVHVTIISDVDRNWSSFAKWESKCIHFKMEIFQQ